MKKQYDFAALAGLATWLAVYSISFYILHKITPGQSWLAAHLLFISYGGLFFLLTRGQGRYTLSGRYGRALLVIQLLIAFALLLYLPANYFDFFSVLTIIWVAMLPFVMSTRWAMLVVLAVVALWYSIVAWQSGHSVWISALLNGCFHVFAVLVQSASRDAKAAKEELEQKHQQLLATQQLLQGASRQAERTRIARNLHDVVGHHLTALAIQLQVAGHLTQGDVKAQIDKCHQLAKLLLSDVREAVSTMRQFTDVSLHDALAPLLAWLPEQLKVKLAITDNIMLHDLQQAQHLLCIVQEALSNSLKHSGASEVCIQAYIDQDSLKLQISDNGVLPARWHAGNGIRGMQERLAECGGSLEFATKQQAMMLCISLPYRGGDSA